MRVPKINGFNLVELVVVIIIVGIISILAIPKWFNNSTMLNAETDRLINNIYLAQKLAINSGYDAIISFTNCQSYSIKLQTTPEKTILDNVNIDESISITTTPCDDIEFTKTYGLLSATNKTISLVAENTGRAKDITIDNFGEITITSY